MEVDRFGYVIAIAALFVAACGGGDDSTSTGQQSGDAGAATTSDAAAASTGNSGSDAGAVSTMHAVGGTISGLKGTGLVLQDNGGDDILVSMDGTFKFTTKLAKGAPYAVTVKMQPTGPSQTCTVANGTGTVPDADVTNVAVTCATN